MERRRLEALTALAMVSAYRWRLRDGRTFQERAAIARRAPTRDADVVKVELCQRGVVSALEDLHREGRYRLARAWTHGVPSEDLERRALRWFFNRAIRIARDTLRAEDSVGISYIEGVHGAQLPGDAFATADEGPDAQTSGSLWDQLLLAATGPAQQKLVAARRQGPEKSLAAVARELGMTPGAARQAWFRLKRRARKTR